MTAKPAALVLDDGELEQVRAVLQELGVEYAYLRGAAIPDGFQPPESGVLITTARRALSLRRSRPALRSRNEPAGDDEGGPRLVRIVVVSEESRTLRAMLRGVGFDFLVRQPVHRAALRLLLLRALYRGPERRRVVRLPVGCDVTVRSGLRRRRASLVEISARGCRLITPAAAGPGTSIDVALPASAADGKALWLRSQVVRCRPGAEGGGYTIGVSFAGIDSKARERLQTVLQGLASGGAAAASSQPARSARSTLSRMIPMIPDGLRRRVADRAKPAEAAPETPPAEPGSGRASTERRRHPRYSYPQRVVALQDEAERVLMGRDLSVGGMRVDPQEELELGDRLELAVYGPEEQPLVVRATVARDDGEQGLGLVFDKVDEETSARLESFVATLPPVETLRSAEADNLGAVVSEIRSRG